MNSSITVFDTLLYLKRSFKLILSREIQILDNIQLITDHLKNTRFLRGRRGYSYGRGSLSARPRPPGECNYNARRRAARRCSVA